ncbi:peroxisomal membrane protein 11 homolog [Lingula anatina]|uniref:Peroxisomal membrane protein 11 homolog n=1 Tax=Lingula anatina TaxID=7574 RepID=A0A1S3IBQ0_LINAN|nr:peroxisomal membrane protein 11 homolog [Lingula anatina]|eukprot:XP_013395286.1 peroxisomal membrane protein 11 homolog [Lingula anatina]
MSTHGSIVRDIIKFNSYTSSRDKIYRICQYASRLVLWYMARQGKTAGDLQEWFQKLEAAMTTSRKLFRLATSLEFLQKAVDASKVTDNALVVTILGGMLGKALWLLIDHLLWLGKVNLVQVDMKKWSRRASWFWLVGQIFLVARDVRKLQLLMIRAKKIQRHGEENRESTGTLRKDFHTARLEAAKDILDILIPLSSLEFISKGFGAGGGLLSSFIGFRLEWEKNVRPYTTKVKV